MEFFDVLGTQRWQVSGEKKARRGGQIGIAIASIGLKHSQGYVVVLQFDDGKIDSFNPHMLSPA
ncbi:hypothetical protein [Prosthecobacter sp.]|uniref:hypothetical protein n=1 Tax=Prosthecobacter sp. TaxID=1965333 RepID=UPI0037850CFC